MQLKNSKTRIIVILSLVLSTLVFLIAWFYAFKSKELILNNKISTLTSNFEYIKDIKYLKDIFEKVEDNTNVLKDYTSNTININRLRENGYVSEYYDSLMPELSSLIQNTKFAQGVWVQIDPKYIISKTNTANSAWYIRKNGKDYRYYDELRKLTKEEDPWYYKPLESNKPVWSNIYIDSDLNIPMVTYSMPVYKDNVFVGVVGIDLSIKRLYALVNEIKYKYKNSNVFILENNNVIASSLDNLADYDNFKIQPLSKYKNGSYNIFSKFLLKKSTNKFFAYKQNGIDNLVFFADLPNGFSYVLVIPNTELLKGYSSNLLYILLISAVIIIISIFVLTKLITGLLNPFQNIEKRLAHIMDNSWNEISIIDANTLKIIYLNNVALSNLGYSINEMKNFEISQLNLDWEESNDIDDLQSLISGEKEFLIINSDKKREDGSLYHVESHIQYFKNEEPPIFVIISKDISQQKELESKKNEFISMVSHELRTPLTSIEGSLTLILSGICGELTEKTKNMLNIAHNNSIRLIRIINDILDFEKISAGKMEFKINQENLMQVIEQAVNFNKAYADQYKVNFVIDKTLPEAKVDIDSDRFIQVITNLLSNAAKYSETGGDVKIDTYKNDDKIRVAVTNIGSEIPEDYKSKIFQEFSQSSSAITRKKGGTGLGLSICKLIMKKLNGSIGYESENSRTTFFVDLPDKYNKN